MKKTKIAYWIFTILLAGLMTMSALPNIMVTAESVAIFKYLGYPEYLVSFIGVAKLLGSIAILVPGFPRIKEWAYAGFTFDLIGAMYSTISVGAPFSAWSVFFIGFAIIAASYFLYHRLQKLQRAGVREEVYGGSELRLKNA